MEAKQPVFFHGSGRSSTRRMRELQCKTGTIWLVLRFGVISKRETILYKFHKVCAHLYSGTHSLLPLCCLYYNTLRRYERLCIIHSPFSTVDPICYLETLMTRLGNSNSRGKGSSRFQLQTIIVETARTTGNAKNSDPKTCSYDAV